MIRLGPAGLLLAGFLSAVPWLSQTPGEASSVFGNFSNEQLAAIAESRRLAFQELAERSAEFKFPEIANALSFPSYLIAIAKIVAVELPKGNSAKTTIYFHIKQVLRGESEITDFEVESGWTPKSPEAEVEHGFSCDGQCGEDRILDRTEPKVGDVYILGYTFDYTPSKKLNVAFALDMQDPAQARLVGEVQHFLKIESGSTASCFDAYLEELNSSVPWVRDIAVRRLTESDLCNASPDCAKRFMAVVTQQLQSKMPHERFQAINWLVWVDSVSQMYRARKLPEGVPILPDSVIGQLLSLATGDPNVYIGDQAFQLRELSEFGRSGKPGDCIQVVPPLRKSAHRHAEEPDLLPAGFPLTSVTSCIPSQKIANR